MTRDEYKREVHHMTREDEERMMMLFPAAIVAIKARIAWLEGWIEGQTGKTTKEVQAMGPQLPESESKP